MPQSLLDVCVCLIYIDSNPHNSPVRMSPLFHKWGNELVHNLVGELPTWIWTNVFFLWGAPHGLGILEPETILALSEMEWNEEYYSLPCSWNLLVRCRKKQKESFIPSTEDAERPLLASLEQFWDLALLPQCLLLSSGSKALCIFSPLHFAITSLYVA